MNIVNRLSDFFATSASVAPKTIGSEEDNESGRGSGARPPNLEKRRNSKKSEDEFRLFGDYRAEYRRTLYPSYFLGDLKTTWLPSHLGGDNRDSDALFAADRHTSPKRQKVSPVSWKPRRNSPTIPVVYLSDEEETVDSVASLRTRARKSTENDHPTDWQSVSTGTGTDDDDVMEVQNVNAGGRTDGGARNDISRPYVTSSSSQKGHSRGFPYFKNSEFHTVEDRMNPRKKSLSQPPSQEGRAAEMAEESVRELRTEGRKTIFRRRPMQNDPIEVDELESSSNDVRMHSRGMEKNNGTLASHNGKSNIPPGSNIGSFHPRKKMHEKLGEPADVDSSIDELQLIDHPPPTAHKTRTRSPVRARDNLSREPNGSFRHRPGGSSPDELTLHSENPMRRQLEYHHPENPMDERPSPYFKKEKSSMKRLSKVKRHGPSLNGWRLNYFGMQNLSGNDLNLVPNPSKNRFDVFNKDGTRIPLGIDYVAIEPKNVNSIHHDNVSRLRLCGASINRFRYIRNLEFASSDDFKSFMEALESETKGTLKKHEKSQQQLQKIFEADQNSNQELALLEKRVSGRVNAANGENILTFLAEKRSGLRGGGPSSSPPEPGSATDQPVPTPAKSETVPAQTEGSGNASPAPQDSKAKKAVRSNSTNKGRKPARSPPGPVRYSKTTGLGPPWSVNVMYPPEGKNRTEVKQRDLEYLDEGEYLHDTLIHFYMDWVFRHSQVSETKVHTFSTFFYHCLASKSPTKIDYDRVKNWTRNVDLFAFDYVVVPVHDVNHWYLAIICNLPNLVRKPDNDDDGGDGTNLAQAQNDGGNDELQTQDKGKENNKAKGKVEEKVDDGDDDFKGLSLTDLVHEALRNSSKGRRVKKSASPSFATASSDAPDPNDAPVPNGATGSSSAGRIPAPKKTGPGARKVQPQDPAIIILDSLDNSHKSTAMALRAYLKAEAKDKRGMDIEVKEVQYVNAKGIPQQPNMTDCGIYLLNYFEKFMEDPDLFIIRLLTKKMNLREDWPDSDASKKRAQIRNLLFDLQKQQEKEKMEKKKKRKEQGNGNAGGSAAGPGAGTDTGTAAVTGTAAATGTASGPGTTTGAGGTVARPIPARRYSTKRDDRYSKSPVLPPTLPKFTGPSSPKQRDPTSPEPIPESRRSLKPTPIRQGIRTRSHTPQASRTSPAAVALDTEAATYEDEDDDDDEDDDEDDDQDHDEMLMDEISDSESEPAAQPTRPAGWKNSLPGSQEQQQQQQQQQQRRAKELVDLTSDDDEMES
ncbi:cysteine proteinase [Saccharata proteae CBS 121410]|uniref:Cysteine proteinase n=1 Tax=Saccharata proteae CBS 121410 TaxID=1314787 RepID=A0A9P4I196_9PEZI|nr:cysteine proteinase [Saccharata proteae CBS 121410]